MNYLKQTVPFLIAILFLFGCSKKTDVEQIKADLIGQTLGSPGRGWRFESLSEFKDFKIENKREQGDIVEYDTSMLLHDARTGKQYHGTALIVYKKTDDKWQIASISGTVQ